MIVARIPHFREVLHDLGRPLWLLLGWDAVITTLYVPLHQHWVALNDLPMSLIGSALAIFVSLRNNSAYARWWEARQLWGGVVNASRGLGRQARLYLPQAAQAELCDLVCAFAHALCCQLRGHAPRDLDRLLPSATLHWLRNQPNTADAILAVIADRLAVLRCEATLEAIQVAAFDTTLHALTSAQGGAERIRNTPLPRAYTLYPRLFVQAFCVLLPLATVTDLGLATPLGSTLVGFIFLALDRAGRDLQDPFANTSADVPMASLCRTIEISLANTAGRPVPEPLQPVDGVLW